MARAFISVPVPSEAVAHIRRLKRTQQGIRWTDLSQWHVTLCFFERCDIEEVGKRFSQIKANPVSAVFGPRVRVLGQNNLVIPVKGLSNMARQVQQAIHPHNSEENQFPFVGHLTLGRLKGVTQAEIENARIEGSFNVNELELVQSFLGSSAPTHKTVRRLLLPS